MYDGIEYMEDTIGFKAPETSSGDWLEEMKKSDPDEYNRLKSDEYKEDDTPSP